MHYRHVSFLTPETQGRWITVKIKIYITAVNQIRKKTQSDVSDDPGFPWNAQKIQTQMYFVHSPTHSAIQQSDPSTCLVALLCLAPCFENSVLWIAGVLSDTCALSDSYLLPTVCYHSSSWKSSSGKRKQQLHSIRMMLVCVCVCVCVCVVMFTPYTYLCLCLLPLGLAVLKITTPLFSYHEEIFFQCMLGGTCYAMLLQAVFTCMWFLIC